MCLCAALGIISSNENMALLAICCLVILHSQRVLCGNVPEESDERYKVEGKVIVQGASKHSDWATLTRVIVDGGNYLGLLRSDGSFTVNGVPPGSYIVEAISPNYIFEPVRVDISGRAKGKIRARKVNFLQNSAVVTVSYPLKFKVKEQAAFFEKREKWRITEMLFNPMVLMMVLPLLLLLVLPKLMSAADSETQKEMQSTMNVFNQQKELPDISDWFAKNFSGFTKKKTPTKSVVKKTLPAGRRR